MQKQKTKIKKSFGTRCLNSFKMVDIYGKSIVLTYDGNESYSTHIGGMFSWLIYLFIIAYFFILFVSLVERENSNVTKNTYHIELDSDEIVHDIGEKDLLFGISLRDGSSNQILSNTSILTYTVKQVSQQYVTDESGESVRQRTKTDINMEECTSSYTKVSSETVERIGADHFMCPMSKQICLT